jgi:periplasmic protein TonB
MELKKSDKANLEKKKGLFLQIGLVTVLALLLIAFEWTTRKFYRLTG